MDGREIQTKIAAALAARHGQRDRAERLFEAWQALSDRFGALVALAEHAQVEAAGVRHGGEPGTELTAALRAFLDGGNARRVQAGLAEAAERVRAVRSRAARPTLNIGVIGQTQAGKSTLLRTISGLSDLGADVLPTSDDLLPTTAARSRIYNSPSPRAEVVLRSFEEFREVYLRPRHESLGLPVPGTLDEFAAFRYPTWDEFAGPARATGRDLPSNQEHLKRLREAQTALPHYRPLFGTRDVLRIGLQDVPAYVSYPPNPAPPNAERRYLAVRDVRIFYPFPNTPVRDLALIDLPGTQERGLDVARQFLFDLRNDVDLLIQVKRPARINVMFAAADSDLQDLAHEARAGVPLGDFMFVLLNRDRIRPDLDDDGFAKAVAEAEDAVRPQGIRVLKGDLIERDQVRERVLHPVLAHLADKLAAMDRAALQDARETTGQAGRDADEAAERLAAGVRRARGHLVSDGQRLAELVKDLRRRLAGDLAQIRDHYLALIREGRRSAELDAAVQSAAAEVREWLADGFGGGGHDEWRARVRNDILLLPRKTVEEEFIRARHFVAGTFRRVVDSSLSAAIAELQRAISTALWAHLPEGAAPADHTLGAFAEALREQGLPGLATPVRDLSELSVGYGDQSLFLRIVQPIVVGIDVEDPPSAPGGAPASPPGPAAASRRDTIADINVEMEVPLPLWMPGNVSVGARIPIRRPGGGGPRGLSAASAQELIPAGQSAEETTRWLADTLTGVVDDVVERLVTALEAESLAAVRALFACADQFLDGFLRHEDTDQELRELCRPHLDRPTPDDGPARVSALARDIGASADAVREAFAAYQGLIHSL
ncbi:hypothetical protein [Actinomadura decatromicini]|uniref:Dynamin family protein n=1 Tax=Actinomadura decatromicini TaxID=2604572 RepID=A0A5D3F8R6_9ACTN|nr:hypothetical protein [Actinomadura decatromicini]TYK44294.1 hypothetical protein FXF68_32925 [Actinomadura decatromicini]